MMTRPALSTAPPAQILALTRRRKWKKQRTSKSECSDGAKNRAISSCLLMSSRHWQLSGLPFFSLLFRILFVDVFRLRDIFCNFRLAFYLVARLFVITLRAVPPCPLYEPEGRFASYIIAHQVCMSSYSCLESSYGTAKLITQPLSYL